jgi:hypothetical protein
MLRAGFALLFGMAMAPLVQAQSMGEAATQLAGRIYSLLQRRTTVSLEFQNLTALAPAESSSFRSALEEELRKAGLETAAQPEAKLRVTIAENLRGLLFVAVVSSGENQQVAMLPWNAPSPAEVKPRVRISRQLVREQPEAVLDMLLLDSGSQLLVLSPGKVSSYRLAGGKWTPAEIAGVSLARPLPRDQRGRIIESGPGGFRLHLPGTTCIGLWPPEIKLTCTPGNEPWQVDVAVAARWVTDRNLLEWDGVRGAFYAAAGGLFATANGRIQDHAGEPIPGTERWGSDLAGIGNSCGLNSLILTTNAGDSTDGDQIQAYEIANGQATAASEPMTLPGPVMALWPAETPGQATLVIRNSKTGNYEASRLGVACAE